MPIFEIDNIGSIEVFDYPLHPLAFWPPSRSRLNMVKKEPRAALLYRQNYFSIYASIRELFGRHVFFA
jgi:hypothetical protein